MMVKHKKRETFLEKFASVKSQVKKLKNQLGKFKKHKKAAFLKKKKGL